MAAAYTETFADVCFSSAPITQMKYIHIRSFTGHQKGSNISWVLSHLCSAKTYFTFTELKQKKKSEAGASPLLMLFMEFLCGWRTFAFTLHYICGQMCPWSLHTWTHSCLFVTGSIKSLDWGVVGLWGVWEAIVSSKWKDVEVRK